MKNRKRTSVATTNAVKRPNPLRIDPSRTITLRRVFAAKINAQFALLKVAVRKFVEDEDAFGLSLPTSQLSLNYHEHQLRDSSGVFGPGVGLGLDRDDMPQVKDLEGFLRWAKLQDVSSHADEIEARNLQPVQTEYRQDRVDKIPDEKLEDPILVSSDMRVLDGTHRWVKHWQGHPAAEVPCVVLDLDAEKAIALIKEWPFVEYAQNFNPDQPRDDHGRFGSGSTIGNIVSAMIKIGATVSHIEHVAKSWVSDGCEAAVSLLPQHAQSIVKASFFATKLIGGKALNVAFVNFTMGQAMAERVAKERGHTPEQARRLRGILSSVDCKTFEVLKVGALSGIHTLHIPMAVSATLPVASCAYLAYSTAKNPLATLRAATGVVDDAVKWGKSKVGIKDEKSPYSAFVTHADEQLTPLMISLAEHDWSDWYIAILHAALDKTSNLVDAVKLADEAIERHPTYPVMDHLPGTSDEDVNDLFGPATNTNPQESLRTSLLENANPYHDSTGRFSTSDQENVHASLIAKPFGLHPRVVSKQSGMSEKTAKNVLDELTKSGHAVEKNGLYHPVKTAITTPASTTPSSTVVPSPTSSSKKDVTSDTHMVLKAFGELEKGSHGLVSIKDVHEKVGGGDLSKTHDAINHLRRQGTLSGVNYETRNPDQSIIAHGIKKHGNVIGHVQRRTDNATELSKDELEAWAQTVQIAPMGPFYHNEPYLNHVTENKGGFYRPENYDKLKNLPDGRELWVGANDWECGWTWAWAQTKGEKLEGREPEDWIEVDHKNCPGCHGDPNEMPTKDEDKCRDFAKGKVFKWVDSITENANPNHDEHGKLSTVDGPASKGVWAEDEVVKYTHPVKNSSVPLFQERVRNASEFSFATSSDKVLAFQRWLSQQMQSFITGRTQEDLWRMYAETGYRKGAGRAFDDAKGVLKGQKALDYYSGTKDEFLRSSFANPVSVEKVKLLAGRSFDDLENVTVDMSTRMSRVLTDGLVQGQSPREVARALDKAVDIGSKRALDIAATECFSGDTLVDGAVIRAVFRRWYEGPIVEIITRNGSKFTATPNHPMLTENGWVAASVLKNGDNLVRRSREQYSSISGNPNVQGLPTTLSEIFDSLYAVGVIERKRSSKPDFHGDGMDGDVEILCADGLLMIGDFSPLHEHLVENVFTPTGFGSSRFCPKCRRLLSVDQQPCFCNGTHCDASFYKSVSDDFSTDAQFIRNGDNGFSTDVPFNDGINVQVGQVLVADPSPLPGVQLTLGIGSADVILTKDLPNLLLIRTDPFGNFSLSQSSQVELDNVESVSIRPFAGHVYNLETSYGYYTVNGYYTGNCIRCHAEGQLDALERLGVEQVGAAVEWGDAGDEKVCERCSTLNGITLTIKEARGKIPLHVRCRCVWLPADIADKTPKIEREQKFDEAGVENVNARDWDFTDDSSPLAKFEQLLGEMPEPLEPLQNIPDHLIQFEIGANVFCSTGKGGGVDSTCSPGGSDKSKFIGAKVGTDVQAHAEKVKNELAKMVNGIPEEKTKDKGQKDKKPYDVKIPKRGGDIDIECKSMSVGKGTSISVHPDALYRKVMHAKATGNSFHTVVFDDRNTYDNGSNAENWSGHRIYYKRGSGRYHLSKMYKVKNAAEMNRLLKMPDDKLPEKAQGSLPPPPSLNKLKIAAVKAKTARNTKDKALKVVKKNVLLDQAKIRRNKNKVIGDS